MTGDNWDDTMFHFANEFGWEAIYYFISMIIIGQMIFLNLFLAIVLDNFDVSDLDGGGSTGQEEDNFLSASLKRFSFV